MPTGPQLPGLGTQGGRMRNTLANAASHKKDPLGQQSNSALPPLDPAQTANYYQQLQGLYAEYQGTLAALKAQRVGIKSGMKSAVSGLVQTRRQGLVEAEQEAIGSGLLGSSMDLQQRTDVRARAQAEIGGVRAEARQALADTRIAAQQAGINYFQGVSALEANKLASQQSLLQDQLLQNLITSGQEASADMIRQMYESQLGGTSRGVAGNVVSYAKTQIGAPYDEVTGSNAMGSINPFGPGGGPGAAFDCSGLTKWAVSKASGGKIELPHSAAQQAQVLPHIGRSALKPGDLVFFVYGRLGNTVDHVGIYVGNGKMIDASSSDRPLGIRMVDWDNFVYGGDVNIPVGKKRRKKGGGSNTFGQAGGQQ